MDCHEGGEPEAGGGYPADEGMGPGRGWRSARAADDWRQCSSANRRSRRRASWGANFRWRARTRALRALRVYIWGSPHEVYLGVYLTMGEPKFFIFLPFPPISGHFAPVGRNDGGWIPGMMPRAGCHGCRMGLSGLPDATDAGRDATDLVIGCHGCRMPRMPHRFSGVAGFGPARSAQDEGRDAAPDRYH